MIKGWSRISTIYPNNTFAPEKNVIHVHQTSRNAVELEGCEIIPMRNRDGEYIGLGILVGNSKQARDWQWNSTKLRCIIMEVENEPAC